MVFFFLLRDAGREGVLRHHDEGVGDTGVEDIVCNKDNRYQHYSVLENSLKINLNEG